MQNLEDITTLAIDTSCDETSVSVVSGRQILANELPSQMEYHSKFGGVVPSLAKLAHSERINNVVDQALKRSGVSMDQIDLIAVTYGPGLAIALEIGLKKAKELAVRYKKPLIAINH
ncbi:tRNA (adenosine(37)-N6)-threonylcarbamoyltransferase complex transferase subunit TsaD, partial [Candidatus Dojkabacteria bacterium]|nr:tRNA (adenosine(37)-N6)-threonylcarbamoyltransferase complex transferase subunit TsaD [Candidatus Dojkabacteria bacterium]